MNASADCDYSNWHGITPQLQFNLRHTAKDRGINADGVNSGGPLLYFSPGVSVRASPAFIAFVQVRYLCTNLSTAFS